MHIDALFTAVSVVTAATLPLLITIWHQNQTAKRRIGTPNGKGNVVQMQEKALEKMDDLVGHTDRIQVRNEYILQKMDHMQEQASATLRVVSRLGEEVSTIGDTLRQHLEDHKES